MKRQAAILEHSPLAHAHRSPRPTALLLVTFLGPLLAACSSSDDGEKQDPEATAPEGPRGRVPCNLDTGHPGDDLCILPPDPEEGVQLHLGPTAYDDPDELAPFFIAPGDENVECFYAGANNDRVVQFYEQYYRMRPGSHHLFVNVTGRDQEGWTPESACDAGALLIGGTQEGEYDYPAGGVTPPEDENLGRPLFLDAKVMLQAHFVNTTEEPILREAWVNYMDVASDAPRMLGGVTMFGGITKAFAPGSRETHGYSCENKTPDRRIVSLFGHRHAHSTRFSAWVNRGGTRELVYEDYDWHEPVELMFNSIAQNPTPDPAKQTPGGASGLLLLQAGDRIEWECDVVNDSDVTLRFGNLVYEAEMCNLFGSMVAEGSPTWTCIPEANVNP